MKKILALILLMSTFVAVMGCSKLDDSDEDIKKAAEELITSAEVLNEIYWGEGLPKIEGGKQLMTEGFIEADVSGVEDYGIVDMQSLKSYTEKVFCANECEGIFTNYLTYRVENNTSIVPGQTVTLMITRYLEDVNGKLYVYEGIDNIYESAFVEYDFSTLSVGERGKKEVSVTLNGRVYNGDRSKSYDDTFTYTLRKEDGEFRLMSNTFCAFDESRV